MEKTQKKLYITTAIPYVNGNPHIGNAMDYLYADIWSRYQKQNGREVKFQAGTDEHGNKIAAKAAEKGMTPKQYTDSMFGNFQVLMGKVGAEYTDFIRTTDTYHEQAVQYIWQQLQPYIYKGSYSGWYCIGCEAFYTDKDVQENGGVCPDHQAPYQQISEENYYLKTSAFTDHIKSAINEGRMEIVPEFRKKEFLELIKDGLKDVSISRPRKSLSWGVPVPGDPDQVMYVWIDALANYLTVLGYPSNPQWKEYWPADVQVIGKDIMRFHAGIWPAMLMGIGVSLPKKLLVHGFINVGGAKISKSVGNTIDPVEIIDNYGLDAFRYFFSRHIPTLDDGDFTWEKFETAYNTELGNDLGNVVQRVASMITRYQAGVIGESTQTEHDMTAYHRAMDALEFNVAMDEVWNKVRSLNQYIDSVKPWDIAKRIGKDPEAESHLSEVLAYSAGALLQVGDLLVPFLPNTAKAIHDIFDTGVVKMPEGILFPKKYLHTTDPRAKAQFMLVDTHCHIHEDDYSLEIEEVLKNAADASVDKMFCVGTDERSSATAVGFAGKYDNIYAIVGVHPHDAKNGCDEISKIAKSSDRVIGIGEIGLDYFYEYSSREDQIEVLRQQIEIALELDLPIAFHVRDAFDDFWPVFDSYKGIRGELHSYTDNMGNLEKALARGLYIGVNGISTFTKDESQKAVYDAIPLDKLLFETDAPFLTPAPFRGNVNEPAHVRLVASWHASRRVIGLEEIAKKATENAKKLYGIL